MLPDAVVPAGDGGGIHAPSEANAQWNGDHLRAVYKELLCMSMQSLLHRGREADSRPILTRRPDTVRQSGPLRVALAHYHSQCFSTIPPLPTVLSPIQPPRAAPAITSSQSCASALTRE